MIFKKVIIVFLMLCFFASCSSQNKMETEDIFIEKICPAAKRLYGAEAYP